MSNNQSSNPFYKTLWRLFILPKGYLFIWKCHERILPAKFAFARYNDSHNSFCSMCNSGQIETPEHIILHCLFAKSVWSLTPYADLIEQDSGSPIRIQEWVIKWSSNNTLKDKAGVIFSISWSIWKDRCPYIFQGKSLNHHSTARLALKLVNDTETYLSNDVSHVVNISESVKEKISLLLLGLCQKIVLLFLVMLLLTRILTHLELVWL